MGQEEIIGLIKGCILALGYYLAAKSVLSKSEDSFFYTLHKGSRLNRMLIFALVTMTFAFIGLFLFIQDLSLVETWIQYFMGGAGGSGAIQTLRKFSPDQKEYISKAMDSGVVAEVNNDELPKPKGPENKDNVNDPSSIQGPLTRAYCEEHGDTILHLNRYVKFKDRVVGHIKVLSSKSSVQLKQHTLEDVVRELHDEDDKEWGETAIPGGWFELKIHDKITPMTSRFRKRSDMKWFKFFIEIVNVPLFSNIYFHLGNTPEDTHGCVLTGLGLSGPVSDAVTITQSSKAMKEFYDAIYPILQAEKRVFIFIENSFYDPE